MVGFAKPIIKKKEIGPKEEKGIIEIVKDAIKRCKSDKDMAEFIKLALDDMFNGPWNVIVGDKFGGMIAHIPNHFMYFQFKKKEFLVYCTRNMKGAR
ncbi:uncharacterized protein LOC120330885 [Styela clava]|uniref:dynein light chain 1, cytoplasmic-like n=1 Tax=Styela clava TaxID=7725 RepID=UPI00193A077C|nr:dynein light chain 1, cytoplasmic-like [Styela clava]